MTAAVARLRHHCPLAFGLLMPAYLRENRECYHAAAFDEFLLLGRDLISRFNAACKSLIYIISP